MTLSLLSCVMLLFSLLPSCMVSTPLDNQKPFVRKSPKPKSMHFTLYLQDIVNKTDFNIIKGIGGPGITATTAPFGSMFVLKDALTATHNPSSDRLGTAEWLVVTNTLDGLYGIGVTQVNLNLKDHSHKGSISLVGVYAYNTTSDIPVVGGTGDFLFVQGYVNFRPIVAKYVGGNIYSVVKCEFHLFWPPYYG